MSGAGTVSHTDLDCACVTEHRPGNTEPDLHHVHPLSLGGPDTPENVVAVCPNAHRLVHQLLRSYQRAGGTPPWDVRRHYSPYTRSLAQRGWDAYQEANRAP